jgi:hypothetical protein
MSESNKVLVDVLATIVLPKLKGLSEKNAKKMVQLSHKALGDISKKYHKLMDEQAKDLAKQKEKAAKVAKKLAIKEAKKKQKVAKKASKQKQVSLLLDVVKPVATVKPAVASVTNTKSTAKIPVRISATKK